MNKEACSTSISVFVMSLYLNKIREEKSDYRRELRIWQDLDLFSYLASVFVFFASSKWWDICYAYYILFCFQEMQWCACCASFFCEYIFLNTLQHFGGMAVDEVRLTSSLLRKSSPRSGRTHPRSLRLPVSIVIFCLIYLCLQLFHDYKMLWWCSGLHMEVCMLGMQMLGDMNCMWGKRCYQEFNMWQWEAQWSPSSNNLRLFNLFTNLLFCRNALQGTTR